MNERTKKGGGERWRSQGVAIHEENAMQANGVKGKLGGVGPSAYGRERVGEGGDCCAQTGKDIDRLLPVWSARMNMNLKPSPTALQTTRVPSQPRLASYQYYIVSIRSECLYIDL